ncbi:hypothetical protein ES705_01722 [subsurface metagenome]|nr:hypothetical protein [Clostridia bacterium]
MQLNNINKKCKKCTHSCKQLASQTILFCRMFERIKKKKTKVVDLIERPQETASVVV